jgi:urease accessory protein
MMFRWRLSPTIFTQEKMQIIWYAHKPCLLTEFAVWKQAGCPHTAIREDASVNLVAMEALKQRFPDLELILLESGGDNLAATFSPELVDLTIYVIDVCMGADIPRKKGPALMKSDMLVVNKIELAEHVEVDLAQMRADTSANRGNLPFIFGSMRKGVGVTELADFLKIQGGLQ